MKTIKVLRYHTPSDSYGKGVCGTHGMMSVDPSGVTCDRCKKIAALKFKEAFRAIDQECLDGSFLR